MAFIWLCPGKGNLEEQSMKKMQKFTPMLETHDLPSSLLSEFKDVGFPIKQLNILKGWIAIHKDELDANWKLLSNGENFFRIDPLK